MTTMAGIYKIVCKNSGKYYVGSAVNLAGRWAVHRHLLAKGKHNSIHLQRAWDKHGAEAFAFELLERVDDTKKLIEREQHYMDVLKPFGERGYNIAPRAGHTLGAKRTPEQVEKMAARFRGKKLSIEQRAKIGAGSRGRKHSDATIAKMRAARLANNHQVGRPLTEAQKASLHRSGKDHPWHGRKHSDETRLALSLKKSSPIQQLLADGTVRQWRTAREAAKYLGLRAADSIYRAATKGRKAAGCQWRWPDVA